MRNVHLTLLFVVVTLLLPPAMLLAVKVVVVVVVLLSVDFDWPATGETLMDEQMSSSNNTSGTVEGGRVRCRRCSCC